MANTQAFPESVYDFGAQLKAHPWVKRVKLDDATFERYTLQVMSDGRHLPTPADLRPVLTWRMRAAMVPESHWQHRRGLFPPSAYRTRP